MTGMKMAKADEKDCDAAYELMSILENIDRGYYPARESDEDAPTFFEADDRDHLQFLHKRLEELMERAPGFIGRIVGGYCAVILNPKNKIVDPDDDCLSLHPELLAATEEQERFHDSLDHIARVAMGSASGSVRNQWIAARAVSALNGDDNWKQARKPKNYHNSCERQEAA